MMAVERVSASAAAASGTGERLDSGVGAASSAGGASVDISKAGAGAAANSAAAGSAFVGGNLLYGFDDDCCTSHTASRFQLSGSRWSFLASLLHPAGLFHGLRCRRWCGTTN